MSNSDVVLKTGYFAQIKQYQDAGFTPVSIARGKPFFVTSCDEYSWLWPTKSLLNAWKKNTINEKSYKEAYQRYVLDLLNQNDVVVDLCGLTKSKKIVLVCYEKSGSFCHRHLVSDWLKQAGYDCEEFSLS